VEWFIASNTDTHHLIPHNKPHPRQTEVLKTKYALVSVTDTGPGLSPEQLKLICSEGVQFNPNELQAGGGSGLGLWISQQIVDLHGGKMHISSAGLGHGATFEICLPLLPASSYTPDPVGIEEGGVSSSTPPSRLIADFSRPKNVLVVDDTPSNRKMLGRILKVNQIKFDEAENGEICLNKVIAASSAQPPPATATGDGPPSSSSLPTTCPPVPYDLILLDYEMPVLNGPKTAQKLREMGYDMIIIGVTGNVLPEDRDYFLRHGVDAVLPKPVTIASLMETFEKLSSERPLT
jgi:CheY-like chemotaxis protein